MTKEDCQKEATKYKNRKEFQENSPSLFKKAQRNKWLADICGHMEYLSRPKYSLDEIKKEALKYNKRSIFQKKSKGAYLAALRRGLLDQVCAHMQPLKESVPYNKLKKEALKYQSKKDFLKNSHIYYYRAVRLGVLNEICSHMKPLRETWNLDKFKKCLNEAIDKKMSKKLFEKTFNGAYKFAVRNNLLEELECLRKKKHKWAESDLYNCAKNYQTRAEFEKNNLGAYKACIKRGIIDKVCSHMDKSSIKSYPELEIFNLIKEKYPDAKTLKKRKVKIKNKPWIYGFDIDVFIPSKNKGIEFDGDYWHRPDIMAKSGRKNKWPLKDLENYHEIKDSYFLEIGIEILHIKEKDWILNKQNCLDSIFYFLS